MLDNVADPPEKASVTPKPEVKPTPVCTLMSDNSLQMHNANVDPLDLQRMLLTASAHITARIAGHTMLAHRVLAQIRARFDGFDAETERAIDTVLQTPRD